MNGAALYSHFSIRICAISSPVTDLSPLLICSSLACAVVFDFAFVLMLGAYQSKCSTLLNFKAILRKNAQSDPAVSEKTKDEQRSRDLENFSIFHFLLSELF